MSIEEELTEAYKQSTSRLKRPSELDTQIEELFRKQSYKEKRRCMR